MVMAETYCMNEAARNLLKNKSLRLYLQAINS